MVPIAFVFNCICLIVSCVHVAYVYNGFTLFCKNIHPINDAAKVKRCDELFHAKVKNADGDLAANIAGAQVFSVFGLIGWMLGLVVLIIRCATHADFHVMAQRVDAGFYTKKIDDDDEVFASTSNTAL
ncbi:unnamed protein product [Allacma fusca]|uniref:Uncharacterized protein n=1 Tax=Allacma fusca TaxID=39272 RepID=A0A8J2PF12_9HEXA|nr:unnamed protein product [Allacma fusca]